MLEFYNVIIPLVLAFMLTKGLTQNTMRTKIAQLTLFSAFVLIAQFSQAQSGVGIGTSNPNPNAILDIVSVSNNKGVLIPRLTTAQRTAMNTALSASENGLMVFDSDLNGFYFWNGTDWSAITVVQDLQLVGSTLTITNNSAATNIDLAPFSGTNTDNQTLSLTGTNLAITGGNTLDLSPIQDGVNDADSNPTNELQNLSSSSSGTNRTVAITGGTNATFNIADNDNSTTNELVTGATLVGTTLRITDAGGNTNVNLAPLQDGVNDADSNPTNEIQDLQLTGNILTITNNASPTNIDLSAFSGTNTDNQTLSLTGTNLAITGGNTLDLSPIQDGVNDADSDPTNEFQTIARSGSNVTLSDAGGSFSVNDADASTTNEIQDLQLTGNILTITNNASPTNIDLSAFSGTNTDNQTLSLTGTNLAITGGNTLDLSPIQDGVNDADSDPNNEFQTITKSGSTVTLSNGGGSFTDAVNDADASTTNELITGATLVGTTLRITDAGGNTNVNLVGLQDGFEANTDNQNLGSSSAGTNRTVTITGGTNTTFSIADNDNSTANELITGATLVGTTLRITDAGGNTNVNLAPLQDGTGTDNQTLSFNGSSNVLTISGGNTSNLSVLDQNLASVLANGTSAGGNRITGLGLPIGSTDATRKSYVDALDHTDNQTLSISGSNLTIAGGNTVSLPSPSATQEAFKAYVTTNNTITGGAETIGFPGGVYDINNTFDGAKYTPPVNGIYAFTGSLNINAPDNASFTIDITVDGTTVYRKRIRPAALATFIGYGFSTELLLSAGEAVSFVVTYSGTSPIVSAGTTLSFVSGRLVVEL